ncbi:HEAT repeat domain-containing protein [Nocardioides sp. 616]|uniref:HEAT repeat domain-containing protein n=1 Tax=Nocardioides sp. 616 TaxID=2268090 RepID=UPI0013B468D4|nr:HEAT repeat domain-containing protein [Nocardioides sp. 616]
MSESDLLRELEEVGYSVGSLADLRTSGVRYREAISVVLSGLRRATTDHKVKGEIVRALSVPWAKPAATGPLIEEFMQVEDETGMGLRWTVGNALEVLWDDARFDDLVALARDESFGMAREMVVLGLGRSKKPEAGEVLLELLEDPVVSGHAVKALRKLKVPAARAGLERMLCRPEWDRGRASLVPGGSEQPGPRFPTAGVRSAAAVRAGGR